MVDEDLVILGGGAVCFSMGTFWNEGVYALSISDEFDVGSPHPWQYLQTLQFGTSKTVVDQTRLNQVGLTAETTVLSGRGISSADEFSRLVADGKPVLLAKQNLGSCCELWTNEYLNEKIGVEREVGLTKSTTIQGCNQLELHCLRPMSLMAIFIQANPISGHRS